MTEPDKYTFEDPHVRSLTYRLETENPGPIEFGEARAIKDEQEAFSWHLADGLLTIRPNWRFQEEREARSTVEPFLRAWEIEVAARYGQPAMHFRFERADVTEPPPEMRDRRARISNVYVEIPSPRLTEYPAPPSDMACLPELEYLFRRFEDAVAGREPLLTMAYFCLNALEDMANGPPALAQRLNVALNVLEELKKITSHRGNFAQARKFEAGHDARPLTSAEQDYVREATLQILWRWGKIDPSQLPHLTKADLPRLS